MQYESDRQMGWNFDEGGNRIPSYNHIYGFASSIKTCKQYITRCKKNEAEYNPRNFRIFDHYQDVDDATGYVPCVYKED